MKVEVQRHLSASMYCKLKKKKWGRPGNEARVVICYRGKVVDIIAATLHILACGKVSD